MKVRGVFGTAEDLITRCGYSTEGALLKIPWREIVGVQVSGSPLGRSGELSEMSGDFWGSLGKLPGNFSIALQLHVREGEAAEELPLRELLGKSRDLGPDYLPATCQNCLPKKEYQPQMGVAQFWACYGDWILRFPGLGSNRTPPGNFIICSENVFGVFPDMFEMLLPSRR